MVALALLRARWLLSQRARRARYADHPVWPGGIERGTAAKSALHTLRQTWGGHVASRHVHGLHRAGVAGERRGAGASVKKSERHTKHRR